MTSITNMISNLPMPQSPRARIDSRIAAAASAGTISKTDETALETAVDSIGQSLRSGTSAPASTTDGSTGTTSGTSFKDKLNGLIDAQVTSGTLTDAQATELKGIFGQNAPAQSVAGQSGGDSQSADQDSVQAFGQTAAGAVQGHHHHGGGGGGGAMAAIMSALSGTDSTDSSTTSAIDALTGTTATGTTTSTASTSSTSTTGTTSTTTSSSTTPVSSTDLATQQLDKIISFLEKMRESIGSAQTYGTASASNSGTNAAGMVFNGLA